jgi:hypothetical protein
MGEFLGEYPQFYLMPNGEEVEYNELVCPKCGTKADDMYDECDTELICSCNTIFLHNIWDSHEVLVKRHPEVFKKYGLLK